MITYKIPRPIKAIIEIFVLRLSCTFHSRGIGLLLMLDSYLLYGMDG